MIINALYDYYQCLIAEPDSGISMPGYSKARISFALNLSEDGELLDVIDLRVEKGKKLVPREMDVPEQAKRSSGISPYFLCDNSTYVFGFDLKGKPERSKEAFEAFKKLHSEILGKVDDKGAKAVLSFLMKWKVENTQTDSKLKPFIDEIPTSNFVFMLEGEKGFIHEREAIMKAWEKYRSETTSQFTAQCLVTGEISPIARLHPNIKGVPGSKQMGASIVSFNDTSFESYGKKQSYNSPVSEQVASGYGTALNHLLSSNKQKIQISDATTVFWAEKSTSGHEENLMMELLFPTGNTEISEDNLTGNNIKRDPETIRLIHDILTRAREGKPVCEAMGETDPNTRFYILGLSPNAARLSVRFWHVDTFGSLIEKIGMHYTDMAIVRPQNRNEPEFIPVYRILKETAPLGESKNIPPLLGGTLIRSVLTGTEYPQSLYTSLLSRIRSDRNINYVRSSVIKACLVRSARKRNILNKEVIESMSLDENSKNTAYRLGRLFAMLEKAQQDATPGLNSTIKDRYFGAASATPGSVFPLLIRLAQHHISKAEYGPSIDRRIEEVMTGIEKFPAHLNLEEQGLFVLGYYHQRQALYQKSERREE